MVGRGAKIEVHPFFFEKVEDENRGAKKDQLATVPQMKVLVQGRREG